MQTDSTLYVVVVQPESHDSMPVLLLLVGFRATVMLFAIVPQ